MFAIGKSSACAAAEMFPVGKSPYGRDFMGIDAPQRVDENVMDELTTDAFVGLRSQNADEPFFLVFRPRCDPLSVHAVRKNQRYKRDWAYTVIGYTNLTCPSVGFWTRWIG